jgi:hypothetical protein
MGGWRSAKERKKGERNSASSIKIYDPMLKRGDKEKGRAMPMKKAGTRDERAPGT